MAFKPNTNQLTQHPLLWKGNQLEHRLATLTSGHAALDAVLPGHGWPKGAVTELLHSASGHGELSLVLPALASLSQQQYRIALIDPPWIPYPPALYARGIALDRVLLVRTQSREESLWACEQVLRGIPGGALLAWPDKISFTELRRLQLAADSSHKTVFLFRGSQALNESSPASLRLRLDADEGDLLINILKCRGQRATGQIRIHRSQLLQPLMPPLVNSRGSSKRDSSSSERSVFSLATSRTERPSL